MKKIKKLATLLANKNKTETVGTSFTSTANTAPYPKPLGPILRRPWWKKKK